MPSHFLLHDCFFTANPSAIISYKKIVFEMVDILCMLLFMNIFIMQYYVSVNLSKICCYFLVINGYSIYTPIQAPLPKQNLIWLNFYNGYFCLHIWPNLAHHCSFIKYLWNNNFLYWTDATRLNYRQLSILWVPHQWFSQPWS